MRVGRDRPYFPHGLPGGFSELMARAESMHPNPPIPTRGDHIFIVDDERGDAVVARVEQINLDDGSMRVRLHEKRHAWVWVVPIGRYGQHWLLPSDVEFSGGVMRPARTSAEDSSRTSP